MLATYHSAFRHLLVLEETKFCPALRCLPFFLLTHSIP
jgi:hypothetical protein